MNKYPTSSLLLLYHLWYLRKSLLCLHFLSSHLFLNVLQTDFNLTDDLTKITLDFWILKSNRYSFSPIFLDLWLNLAFASLVFRFLFKLWKKLKQIFLFLFFFLKPSVYFIWLLFCGVSVHMLSSFSQWFTVYLESISDSNLVLLVWIADSFIQTDMGFFLKELAIEFV